MNMTRSASCSMLPDSRRSDSSGRLSGRDSTARDSWDTAMTGTPSSRASIFGPHELEVVDDDQAEVAARVQPPRLGAQLEDAEVARVVHVQRRRRELLGR